MSPRSSKDNDSGDFPSGKGEKMARPGSLLSERRRLHILESASRSFLISGFAETSLDQVATEAGVVKQTIYNYFGTKEALFLAACEFTLQKFAFKTQPKWNKLSQERYLQTIGQIHLDNLCDAELTRLLQLVTKECRSFPELQSMYNTAMIAPMLTALSEQFRTQTRRTPEDLRVLGWVFRAALTGYGTLVNLGLQKTESFPSAKKFLTASSRFVIEALAASDAPLCKTTKTKNAPAKTAPEDVIEELNGFLSAGATMSFSKKQVSILAAAAAVFSSRGFTETSVDMIADLARASKQTVYSNYKNKTQLYKATCEAVLTRAREESQAALSKINWQADKAALSKISLILLAQTDKIWLSDFLRVIVGESQSFPGESGAALSYIYRFATSFLNDFASKHVADAGDRAVMIIWVQGLLGTYVLLNKIYSIEDDQTVNELSLLNLVEEIRRLSTRFY